MELSSTQRGKPRLSYEGHDYTIDRQNDKKVYWKCAQRHCHGRAISTKNVDGQPGERVWQTTKHNHPDHRTKVTNLNQEMKHCTMESGRQLELSTLVAAGSTAAPPDVHRPDTTLQRAAGQAYQKVVPEEQDKIAFDFLCSGLAAEMKDLNVSLMMLEKATPLIQSGTGHFGFVYQALHLRSSCFEKNGFQEGRLCGQGAAGEVRAYFDAVNRVHFVRKRNKKGRRFRTDEVRSLIQLNHPGVVKLYAMLCSGSTVDLLLQNAGHPLRDCLQVFVEKKIPSARYFMVILDFAAQGFEALSYIHRNRIGHLDIKPENLLVYQDRHQNPVLVLSDFGSSLSLDQQMDLQMELTSEYWAPEMWYHLPPTLECHKLKHSVHRFPPLPAFDNYAYGACVYYMGTQQHLMKVLEAQQGRLSDFVVPPAEVEQTCQKYGFNQEFAFRFILMTKYSQFLPEFGTKGSWVYPDIPELVLDVIRFTLDPDPGRRWTAEQAAHFLKGKAATIPAQCSVPGLQSTETRRQEKENGQNLKAPTPVDETTTANDDEAQAGKAPLNASTNPSLVKCSAPIPSEGVKRFQREIAPFWKAWDNKVAGVAPDQQQGQPVATSVPQPTSTYQAGQDDIALRREPVSAPKPSTVKATVAAAGCDGQREIMQLRLPGTSVDVFQGPDVINDIRSPQKVEVEVDKDMNLNLTLIPEIPDPPVQDNIFADMGKGCGPKTANDKDEKSLGMNPVKYGGVAPGAVTKVIGKLGALSVQNQKRSLLGVSTGKGGGASKGGRPSGKVGRYKGSPYKETALPVISHGKGKLGTALRKKVDLVAAQEGQPNAGVVFVVGSSSRPKPRARTLQAPLLAAAGFKPGSCQVENMKISTVDPGTQTSDQSVGEMDVTNCSIAPTPVQDMSKMHGTNVICQSPCQRTRQTGLTNHDIDPTVNQNISQMDVTNQSFGQTGSAVPYTVLGQTVGRMPVASINAVQSALTQTGTPYPTVDQTDVQFGQMDMAKTKTGKAFVPDQAVEQMDVANHHICQSEISVHGNMVEMMGVANRDLSLSGSGMTWHLPTQAVEQMPLANPDLIHAGFGMTQDPDAACVSVPFVDFSTGHGGQAHDYLLETPSGTQNVANPVGSIHAINQNAHEQTGIEDAGQLDEILQLLEERQIAIQTGSGWQADSADEAKKMIIAGTGVKQFGMPGVGSEQQVFLHGTGIEEQLFMFGASVQQQGHPSNMPAPVAETWLGEFSKDSTLQGQGNVPNFDMFLECENLV